MKCQNCKSELSEGSRFCDECGSPVPGPAAQTAEQEQATAPDDYFPCPGCQTMLPDESLFCPVCGEMVSVYEPPEGFVFDQNAQRYYRSEFDEYGTQWVVWFDANSGEYEEESYPAEPAQSQASGGVMPGGSPPAGSEPAPQPQNPIPEGFILDPGSGLYFISTPGNDPATGASGQWVTWYYPDTGEYLQQFYPG